MICNLAVLINLRYYITPRQPSPSKTRPAHQWSPGGRVQITHCTRNIRFSSSEGERAARVGSWSSRPSQTAIQLTNLLRVNDTKATVHMKSPSQCRAGKLGLSLGFVVWATLPTSPIQAEYTAGVKRKPRPALELTGGS
jgi:hypothetical protein